MKADTARIVELERALADAIAYLRRLPKVGVTVERANELEAVLQRQPPALAPRPRAEIADVTLPNGIVLLTAERLENHLVLRSDAYRADMTDLIRLLRHEDGLRLTLKPLGEFSPLTELEIDHGPQAL